MATYHHSNRGIYQIRNIESGKRYIGSASFVYERLSRHRVDLRSGKHYNPHLQAAFNKYGEDGFAFEKVLVCSKENLLLYEQLLIDGYDAVRNGYNILAIAGRSSSMEGRKHTKETKRKISVALKGKSKSKEHIEACSKARIGKKRGPHSEEHKRKQSMAIKKALAKKRANGWKRIQEVDNPEYKEQRRQQMLEVWDKRRKGEMPMPKTRGGNHRGLQ